MLIRCLLVPLAVALGLAFPSSAAAPTPTSVGIPAPGDRPNIVLVLMDDFSVELLSTMREAQRMRRAGAEFTNAYVVDSMCCPSRAATLTGLPPHLNGVRINTGGPDTSQGGYLAFRGHGNQRRTFNVSLNRAGYRTGFVGKFMNRYEPGTFGGRLPVVPGWDDFEAVTDGGYAGWEFERSTRVGERLVLHRVRRPPVRASRQKKDQAYATNVVADRALRLVRATSGASSPTSCTSRRTGRTPG